MPVSLLANGAVQLLMQYYFISTSNIVKVLMVLLIILCFGSSIILSIFNLTTKKAPDSSEALKQMSNNNFKKLLVSLAMIGLLITPLVGSSAVLFYRLNSSFPAAGLELLSNSKTQAGPQMNGNGPMDAPGNNNSELIKFLQKNKTEAQKYLLVVSSANEAADIIINTGEPVMAIGGFLGNDKSITLNQFIELVKKGEVRYVMTGGNRGGNGGGNSSSEIMNWVQQNGKAVPSSEYNSSSSSANQTDDFGGRNSGQLYDLKS